MALWWPPCVTPEDSCPQAPATHTACHAVPLMCGLHSGKTFWFPLGLDTTILVTNLEQRQRLDVRPALGLSTGAPIPAAACPPRRVPVSGSHSSTGTAILKPTCLALGLIFCPAAASERDQPRPRRNPPLPAGAPGLLWSAFLHSFFSCPSEYCCD